ncbi:Cytochrome c oxidase subunit 4 [Ptychographa xylographoides]|nr:Cytochrome c oxidase subunit 4 [Ptychographa xylographoides]
MFLRRSAIALCRRTILSPAGSRSFTSSLIRRDAGKPQQPAKTAQDHLIPFEDVKSEHDLLPPGGRPGDVPTDLEQATGLERLEILGKMQGVDIFDMKPLDASRKGQWNPGAAAGGAGSTARNYTQHPMIHVKRVSKILSDQRS